MIDYDTELQFHNARLRRAYQIDAADQVLDVGCGTGQTTREAARLASGGVVTGVDVDEEMIARARKVASAEGIPNVRFEVGDVGRHPFRAGEFDVAISRFGTMFFADPETSFRNIAHAIRPEGRLVMMVWQSYDRNEWAGAIDRALGREAARPIATTTMNPFSLAEPPTVRRLLTGAGFDSITLTDVQVPVYYGRDVDAAFDFVSQFAAVDEALQSSEAQSSSVGARLLSTLAAHTSAEGVLFDSRSWIVRARRR